MKPSHVGPLIKGKEENQNSYPNLIKSGHHGTTIYIIKKIWYMHLLGAPSNWIAIFTFPLLNLVHCCMKSSTP